jgi:hypothetical protein
MAISPLADWDNFYVITGSSAAGLTGLTFVVIALAADSQRVNTRALHAFVTPTIVHFGTVFALAAFLSMPRLSLLSLSIGFGAAGVGGLVYVGFIAASIGRLASAYQPVREDWVWNVILPGFVYGALLAIAFLLGYRTEQSIYGVAAVSLALLFIGIHNAWDIAVWNTVNRKQDSQ